MAIKSADGEALSMLYEYESAKPASYLKNYLNWVDAIEVYIKGTTASCLDLNCKHLPFKAVEYIVKFLSNSEIIELNLNEIRDPVSIAVLFRTVCGLLKTTKIQKLSMNSHFLSCSNLLDLAKVLSDTNIVDLDLLTPTLPIQREEFKGRELVAYLLGSPLKRLCINLSNYIDEVGVLSFAHGLPSSRLTSLNIHYAKPANSTFLSVLISKLPESNLKDLKLSGFNIDNNLMKQLSQKLATLKLETLHLTRNQIKDAGLNILGKGLVGSKVVELNLSYNQILGSNDFCRYLKRTKIRALDLSCNEIEHGRMFNARNSLKGSLVETLNFENCLLSDEVGASTLKNLKSTKVSKLNLGGNCLGVKSITAFAKILKDTSLEDVQFLISCLPSEMLDINPSKLTCIQLGASDFIAATACLRFLEKIKNSSVLSVELQSQFFSPNHPELFDKAFLNSKFTRVKIHFSNLRVVFTNFILNLKHMSITHLDLSGCQLRDEEIQLLAEHLKETKIMSLNLSYNSITSEGVRALAVFCPESSLTHLDFSCNNIENDEFEDALMQGIAGSYVTTLTVKGRLNSLKLKKVLWENKLITQKLVAFFLQVFPKTYKGNFCFYECLHEKNIDDFLEECLQFHKCVVERPAAVVSVLLQEESLSFSREELVWLLQEEFPRQFVDFICKWIDADVWQLVEFLEKAEGQGLVRIVELLLLHRPLFVIDEAKSILHPYVYVLLLKYDQPICNEAIEPEGISKIVEFFLQHTAIEGAADLLINLLIC